jgi:glycosyltransferase involved in cell wall biosynthesis
MPGISVVIPTMNEGEYLESTLDALSEQLRGSDEIIIVDSDSTDDTVTLAKRYTDRVFNQPRSGIGPAKTLGAKKASNPVVASLDADGPPRGGWLEAARRHFTTRSDTVGVAGLGLYDGRTFAHRLVYNTYARLVFMGGFLNYRVSGTPWMPVNNVAIKKDVLLSRGGWRNVVCEDLDFAMRNQGLKKIAYDPLMQVSLSDRRFVNDGFIKTVMMWARANGRIILQSDIPVSSDYEQVR